MFIKLGKSYISKTKYLKNYCAIASKMSDGEIHGVSLNSVLSKLENFAPKRLSEDWDNTGLLVEPYTSRFFYYFLIVF